MIRAFDGKQPRLDPTVFISEAAYIVGDITIGAGSSVWPGAVIRADYGPIRIGANTSIQDNTTVHGSPDGVDIGENVTVGHNVVVHCRRIGNNCLIANHATVLDNAEIGDNCVVAAGAVVRPGVVVPDGSFVAGVPATVRPLGKSQRRPGGGGPNNTNADIAARFQAAGLGDPHP